MSRKGENIYHRKDGRWEGRLIIGRKEKGGYRFRYVYGKTYREVKEKLFICRQETAGQETIRRETAGRETSVYQARWKQEAASRGAVPDRVPGYRQPAPQPSEGMRAGQPLFQPVERQSPGSCAEKICDYAVRWLSSMRYKVKESTYMKYWNLVNSYIIPELGGLAWPELNRETLELFLVRMRTSGGKNRQGLSPKTVSDVLAAVRQISRYAVGYGEGAVFNLTSVTARKEEKEMQVLTTQEQEILCRFLCSDPDDRSLGELICLHTGIRIGEVCALRWEDISTENQTISINKTMQRIQVPDDAERKTKVIVTKPKSPCSIRQIPIPDKLAALLESRRKGRKGYVLTGREDAWVEPRAMERHFAGVLRKAGIQQVNFHALRHTFATRCVEMGFDIKCLSILLGHANVNITLNRYVHPSMDQKRKNMQKLSELLAVS